MNIQTLSLEINQSADQFINQVARFDPKQLNTIPFPGSWTAGQVARHIIMATDGIPDTDTKPADRVPMEQVEAIRSVFLDFNIKFNSPDFIIPENSPFDRDSIIMDLTRIKQQNIKIAQTRDISALCMDFALPTFGYLTRYEWLKFIVFHTQRHTYQLEKIAEKILVTVV